MSEGTPDYDPNQQLQQFTDNDSGKTHPEKSKPPSLRNLIPQRLKGLFNRQPNTEKQAVTNSTKPIGTPTSEHTLPTVVPPFSETSARGRSQQSTDLVSQPDTLQLDTVPSEPSEATQALENTVRQQSALEPVSEASIIHPDIEEGVRHILEEKLVDAVRIGSTAGIEVSIKNLGKAWKQAQQAANATFELTPEGREVIPSRVKEICAEHIQEGLAAIYRTAEYNISHGMEHAITGEAERVIQLYNVADEFQIPLTFLPAQSEEKADESFPAVLITTREQAVAHMQEVIERNLPRGVKGLIDQLGYQVEVGLLKNLSDYEKRIERWINIMQNKGWTVVDQPTTPVIGEEQSGILPRQVNRAEIRQLIDQAVRDNLAKGAQKISEMVGFQIRSGWSNPFSSWGTPENIALYTEAGQRYGLTHNAGVTTESGTVNQDMYFDPTELPAHIKEAVLQNLPTGLAEIQKRHLSNIQSGDARQIMFAERTLDQYIGLAEEYGVPSSPDELRNSISSHITPENLQQGVTGRLNAIKEALRKADYTAARLRSRDAEEFRRFVHDRGFDGKIDFSELDKYLQETATEIPRLE